MGNGMFWPLTSPRQPWASSPQVNHLRCLHEFVESQTTYYAQCYRHMLDLQKQLGRCPPGSPGSQPQPPQTRKAPRHPGWGGGLPTVGGTSHRSLGPGTLSQWQ